MRRLVRCAVALVVVIPFFAMGTVAEAVSDVDAEYVGSKKCRKCHTKEYKSWAKTNMAKTFEVLKPGERAEQKTAAGLDPAKDYTKDVECVRCHTTGYGKPGGFVDIETTPQLAGIGCEVCHGPGGTYIKEGYMTMENKEYAKADLVAVGMVDTVAEAQCRDCHTTDSPFVGDDYVFDFEANKTEGTHDKFKMKYSH